MHVLRDHLAKARLEDRHFTRLQGGDLVRIFIDADDSVSELGEACARYQADITGTDHRNTHVSDISPDWELAAGAGTTSARPGKERENRRFANPPAAVGHRPPAHVFTQFALRFRLAKLYNQEAMRAGSAAVPPLAGVGRQARVTAFALWVVGLPRYAKRVILVANDLALFGVALWLAMSLRLGEPFVSPTPFEVLLLGAAPFVGVTTFFQLGLYRAVTRYPNERGAGMMVAAIGLSTLYWGLLLLLAGAHSIPRSVVLLYPMLATLLILGSRQAAAIFLKIAGARAFRLPGRMKRVLIYGAGMPGIQLLDALRSAGNYQAVGFIDPGPTLRGQFLGGVKVYPPDRISELQRHGVDEVFLALPKSHRRDRRVALSHLEGLKVRVRTLPAIEDVAAGHYTVSDLRPVETEDLLGRDPVPADPMLLARNIAGKSVMVTGAGGSIGAELATPGREATAGAPRACGDERGSPLRNRAGSGGTACQAAKRSRRADRRSLPCSARSSTAH